MELPFSINNLFGQEISLVDTRLTPFRNNPQVGGTHKKQLCQVLDKMGEASAKAQGLHGPITSASRMQTVDQNHHLYVMIDAACNNGQGQAVGILKMGHKKLFIYDHHGAQHEMDPLCVLDFYVHESRQRTGCGKRLFNFMLENEGIKPSHLAVDRPSHKFLAFLNKHYHLKATIPQVNNYVVFDGFFRDRTDTKRKGGRPPLHPYKKGSDRSLSGVANGDDAHARQQREDNVPPRRQLSASSILSWGDPSESPSRDIKGVEYIRSHSHSAGPPSDRKEALSHVPIQRSTSRDSFPNTGTNGCASATNTTSHRTGSATENMHGDAALMAKQSMYSRHAPEAHSGTTTQDHIDVTTQRKDRDSPPIMLRRDGPSEDFQKMSRHTSNPSNYQDSRGRLRLESAETTKAKTEQGGPVGSRTRPPAMDSSWNLFGVPPRHATSASASSSASHQHHGSTRLW